LSNKTKRYIHVPQCTDSDYAHTAFINYKVVEQIVETVGGGVKSPEGLDVGALWFGKRLAETNPDEFTAYSPRAGITVTARMSPEATAAMWNDALLTKTKQRKVSKHLFKFAATTLLKREDKKVVLTIVKKERRLWVYPLLANDGYG
jgi:hypothetical protein